MKKVLSIAFIFILSLGLVCTRPFDIHADSYMDHIVGTTYSNQKNIITWTFDEHILGSMDVTISYKLSPNGAVNQIRPYIRVNGTQVSYVIYNDWLYDVSFTIDNSYFEPVSSMDFSTIITYLSQMYDNQEDIYQQLLLIYNNTNLSNNYLQQLTQLRQYNIPFESSNFINFYFNSGYELYEWSDLYFYQFPIFNLKNNQDFDYRFFYNNLTYTYIFAINQNMWGSGTGTNILNYLDLSNFDYSYRSLNNSYFFNSPVNKTIELKIKLKSGLSNNAYHIKYVGNDCHIIPIFVANDENIQYVSTDFALLFGLSNRILDDLHIIAQGNQASNSSVSNLEDMNDDYDDVSQQVFGLENNFSTGFNSSMQNVPTTFNFGTQFGNKFLATATWVRNQFDTMTTNTPFGALITFSLVLGLALLIVGRRLL